MSDDLFSDIEAESTTAVDTVLPAPETAVEPEPPYEEPAPEAEEEIQEDEDTGLPDTEESDESKDFDPPEEEKEEKEEKEDAPATYTVKVDGIESEVSLEELRRNYQIGSAAEKRLSDAKRQRDQMEVLAREMRDDPMAFALRLYQTETQDPRLAQEKLFQQAVEFVRPILQEQALPEEERRVREEKRLLDYQRQDVEQQRSQMQQQQQQAAYEREKQHILSDVDSAMKETGLDDVYDSPQSRKTVQFRIIRVMSAAQETNPESPMTAQEAAGIVRTELEREMKHLMSTLKPEELEKVNPKAARALRQRNISEAKKKRAGKGKASNTGSTLPRKQSRPMTNKEFFDSIEAGLD